MSVEFEIWRRYFGLCAVRKSAGWEVAGFHKGADPPLTRRSVGFPTPSARLS